MQKAFLQYIEKEKLFTTGEKLLVAVSGGIDSVVLFHLLHNAGFDVAIAHCNFGLRGDESDEDENFVRNLALETGVSVFVKQCNAGDYAKEQKITVQEAARELRYEFFNDLVQNPEFSKVALAHNADDNLESFFINLSRATGLKGLTGIPVKRGAFVRPLLFATRKQIEEYAFENRIKWREDSSNAGDKYLRNRIRHHLMPVLKEVYPGFPAAVRRTMENLSEAEQLFRLMLKEKRAGLIHTDGNRQIVDVKPLFFEPGGELLLYYLLKPYGFDRDVVSQLTKSMAGDVSGKWFYAPGYRLLLDRGKLILTGRDTKDTEPVWIHYPEMEIEKPLRGSCSVKAREEVSVERNPAKAWFDLDKLVFPLQIRPWRQGDRMVPFGMKQSKPVSDILTNKKISLIDKEHLFLLLSGDEILWVMGLRNSACCRVTKSTKKVLEAELITGK